MPRVRFTKVFDWPVNDDPANRRRTVQYRPGMKERVTTKCAEAAVAAGAGQILEEPKPVEVPEVEEPAAEESTEEKAADVSSGTP